MNVDWAGVVNDRSATDLLRAVITEIEALEADGIRVPTLVVGALRVDAEDCEDIELWRIGSASQGATVARFLDNVMFRRSAGMPPIGTESDVE